MADEKRWTGSMRGRFLLGENYGEPGPGLASGAGPVPEPRSVRTRRMGLGLALALAAGGVFALGLGMRRRTSSPPPPVVTYSSTMDSDTITLTNFPPLPDGSTPDRGVIAYPLPAKPFNNQSPPPCKPRETEFNGGCWQAIAQHPPCDKDVLEHQGKCFIPVGKRSRLPQAVEPAGK